MMNYAMNTWLEPEELEVLTGVYRLSLNPLAESAFSIPFADLLNQEKCQHYLRGVGDIFETTSETATVSLFAKRYAYLVVASGLYAMSLFNKGLNVTLENGWIESSYQGETWLPKARLLNTEISMPQAGLRKEWRDQIIQQMFAGNLSRVWNALPKTFKISKAVLWENTAIYVYWLYEKKYAEGASSEQRKQIEEDYHYLLHDAPADLFGESRNPLQQFNNPKTITSESDTPIRVRKTCCYYYLTSDEPNDYCSTCPKRRH